MARSERINMRVDPDIKELAESASDALNCGSLTEFFVRLVKENAPRILEEQRTIKMTQEQMNLFSAACEDVSWKPSKRIMKAAKRLKEEGY